MSSVPHFFLSRNNNLGPQSPHRVIPFPQFKFLLIFVKLPIRMCFEEKPFFGLPSSFLSLLAYKKLKGFQIIGQRCWKHFVFFTSFKQMTVTNNDELTANSLTKNLKTILLSWVHKVLAHTLCLFVFFKKSPELNTHLHIIIVPLIFNRITLLCTLNSSSKSNFL